MEAAPNFIVRRIPLAQMYREKLVLGLECSICGTKFATDYYSGGFTADMGSCPKCGVKQRLIQADLRRVLEERFRGAAKRIKAKDVWLWTAFLSYTITRAANLLEPILFVAVARMDCDRIGEVFETIWGYLTHLDTAGKKDALLFGVPPTKQPNKYLTQKFGERFIIAPAAASAYHRLLEKPRFFANALSVARNLYLRVMVRNPKESDFLLYKWSKPFIFRHAVDLLNPQSSRHRYLYRGIRLGNQPLTFSTKEKERAKPWLERHGIGKNGRFVCFLGRDRQYVEKVLKWNGNYHDYRNLDANSFLPAMYWLAEQCVSSIRMGSVSQVPLAADGPGLIDFASDGYDEFIDIYLTAHCLFYVSVGSGPDQIAAAAGRSVLLCNTTAFYADRIPSGSNLVMAPKKIWCHRKRRLLTMTEMFELEKRCHFYSMAFFYENYISLINNDPTDTRDYVREMYARVTGAWKISDDEKRLQDRYHALIRKYHRHAGEIRPIMCYTYLQRNPHLLSDVEE